MRQINPIAKAWANVEKSQHKHELYKAYRRRREKPAREYLDGTHLFERSFSDVKTGETKIMGGREAKELNAFLFQEYIKLCDANNENRSLERWKVIKRFYQSEKHYENRA